MIPSKKDEGKVSAGDILFLVVLILVLLFLIPFYSSIFEVLKLSAQFMVGADTYIGLLGSILGGFMLFLGIKHHNNAIKVFGLLLTFAFLLSPFYTYLGKRNHLKESLGKYTFQGITVIQPDSCQLEEKAAEKISDTFQTQFGSDLDIDSVESTPLPKSNASWKEKLRCMATETHYVYKITYQDAFDEKRTILYDGDENFDNALKVHSYEILYGKIGEYLEEYEPLHYQLKVYGQGKAPTELNRTSVINEKINLPNPNEITLKNFYQDKRLVLEIWFQRLKDKNKIHQLVSDLEEKSVTDFPVIIHYGNTSEYYLRGLWYPFLEKEFITKLIGSE